MKLAPHNQALIDMLNAQQESAQAITGLVTQMQDLLALLVIACDREKSGKSGRLKEKEYQAIKRGVSARFPHLSQQQLRFIGRSLDIYFDEFADMPVKARYDADEPSLDDLPHLVVKQLTRAYQLDEYLSACANGETVQ